MSHMKMFSCTAFNTEIVNGTRWGLKDGADTRKYNVIRKKTRFLSIAIQYLQ